MEREVECNKNGCTRKQEYSLQLERKKRKNVKEKRNGADIERKAQSMLTKRNNITEKVSQSIKKNMIPRVSKEGDMN
jgi:phage protein U